MTETSQLFTELQATMPLWNDSKLWQHAQITEDGFHFDNELLQHAMEQKLANAGLSKERLSRTHSVFTNGGWPMQTITCF